MVKTQNPKPHGHSLVDAILDAPNLNETSKGQYLETIASVTRLLDKPLDWVIDHPDETIAAVSEHYTNAMTRRSLMTGLKAVFRFNDPLMVTKKAAYDAFTECQTQASQEIDKRYLSAEPSERERRNWVPWDQVLAREAQLSATQFGSTDHLLLAMYCLIEPLRQDFGVLRVVLDHPPEDTGTGNHLVIARNASWGKLILNDYKTSKHYSTLQRDLPSNLLAVIKASLMAMPRRYLFVTTAGKPYEKANSFQQFSNRTLKRLFGKNVTVSTLRHSRISATDFNASTPGQLMAMASNMAHGLGMQQMYRRNVQPLPSAPASTITHGKNGEKYITLSV